MPSSWGRAMHMQQPVTTEEWEELDAMVTLGSHRALQRWPCTAAGCNINRTNNATWGRTLAPWLAPCHQRTRLMRKRARFGHIEMARLTVSVNCRHGVLWSGMHTALWLEAARASPVNYFTFSLVVKGSR